MSWWVGSFQKLPAGFHGAPPLLYQSPSPELAAGPVHRSCSERDECRGIEKQSNPVQHIATEMTHSEEEKKLSMLVKSTK